MNNAHSEAGQMAVCCQNLTLGVLSSRSTRSVLVGALFKKFGLFLNTPRILFVSRTDQITFDYALWETGSVSYGCVALNAVISLLLIAICHLHNSILSTQQCQ
jgi:hypothetical protein